MTIQPVKQVYTGIFLALAVVLPACAETAPQLCEAGRLLKLSSVNLSDYEKIKTALSGESSEGASIEYYYSSDALAVIKSVYYGETGKTELEYYFDSPATYTSKLTEYYYSAPIYIDDSEIVAINQSNLTVCQGRLVRGVGDDVIVAHFDRASRALKNLRENAPKNQTGQSR